MPMPSFKGQAWGQSPVDWSNHPGVQGGGAWEWGGEFWALRIVQSGCTKLHPFLLLTSVSQTGFSANTPPGCFKDGFWTAATCGGSQLGLLPSCAALNEFDNLSEP